MATLCCSYCNKTYIRKFAYNNHIEKCKLHYYCKNSKPEPSINIEDISIENMPINNESIFKLLINLQNKYEKLQEDYDELKKYVTNKKSKINIIDYLNQNFYYRSFDYNDFINSIVISDEDLDIIFKKDYVDGFLEIITKNIEKIKYINNIPLKAFNIKENNIYIYNNNITSWTLLDANYLNNIIKYFDKKILALFLEWKKNNEIKFQEDQFSEIYILNMKKVVGGNFDKKNKKLLIKNKLYKYLKVNIKEITSYEFE